MGDPFISARGMEFDARGQTSKNGLSTGWTIVVTAALFSLIHMQPINFLPIFALGMMLGWARHAYGGLGLPVAIYWLNNAFAVLVALRP